MSRPVPVALIVDDSAANRRLIAHVLERDGFRAVECGSGEAALATLPTLRPDVIVLDLQLPGMTGAEVARRVRSAADRRVATTPMLACSAASEAGLRLEALAAGCDDFVGKPLDVATFGGRVRALLEPRAPAA